MDSAQHGCFSRSCVMPLSVALLECQYQFLTPNIYIPGCLGAKPLLKKETPFMIETLVGGLSFELHHHKLGEPHE